MTAAPDDPYRPYRRVGTALAALVVVLVIVEFARNAVDPTDRDFISFWAAAKMALWGAPAAAYDNQALHALQAQFVTFRASAAEMPFPYPPAFLLLLMPFAALPFAAGMAAWSLVTLGGWLAVVRRMFPRSGWIALGFPPVYANAAVGQNGFLTAALFAGGLGLLSARPFVAGLVLGCLVLKPQLALLLPVALLAAREWRAISGAAISAVSVLLVGLVLFGGEASRAWIQQMPLYAEIGRHGLVGWPKLTSVYAAARQAGLSEGPALSLHAGVAAVAAWAVWRVWRSDVERLAKVSVLVAASMLASPYLFYYDAVILAVPLLFLAGRKAPVPLLATLWLAPALAIAVAAAKLGPINIGPLIPIAILAVLWPRLRRDARDTAPAIG